MLNRLLLLLFLVISFGLIAQTVPFISPLTDSTTFEFQKTDSLGKNIGSMELMVLKPRNGSARIKLTEITNKDTVSFVFSYKKDTTGFVLSPFFFIQAKEVKGFNLFNLKEPKEKLIYPASFTPDTLDDLSIDLHFEYDGQKLADYHIQFLERTIDKGEFIQTPFERKYCYKVATTKKESILFREKTVKFIDWYSTQGIVKREVFENDKLLYTYLLKKVKS